MAFEPITELSTKLEALQELVDKSILTKNDLDLCTKALKRKETEKGLIYRDKFIAVYYRGYEEEQTYNGKEIQLYLIIQNRTAEPLHVHSRIYVNGIIINKDAFISRDIPEKSKVIEKEEIDFSTLKMIDVNSIKDIEEISFLFWCTNTKYKEIARAKKPVNVYI